jgi:hypothetical protein
MGAGTNRVRGSTLGATKRWILEQGGPEALARVLRALPEAERQAVARPVDAGGWIAFDSWLAFADATDRIMGTGNGAVHRAVGRWTAAHDLQPVYARIGAAGAPGVAPGQAGTVADISLFVGFVAELWRQYFSSGAPEVERSEPGYVVVVVREVARPAQAVCERVLGFMEQAAEGAGVRGTAVTHPLCAARGDAACRFELRWIPAGR